MQKRDVVLTAVFSSLAALILITGIGAACYFFHKRRRKRNDDEDEEGAEGASNRAEASDKKSKLNGFLSLKTPLISTKTLGYINKKTYFAFWIIQWHFNCVETQTACTHNITQSKKTEYNARFKIRVYKILAEHSICTYKMIYNPKNYSLPIEYKYDISRYKTTKKTVDVTIDESVVGTIQSDTFNNTDKIVQFAIRNSQVREIEPGGFANFGILKTVILFNNSIGVLKNNTFSPKSNISHLALPNNNMSIIEIDAFANLAALEALDLSYNNISNFACNLSLFGHLKELNISYNYLKTIQPYNNLKAFERLNMSHNKIVTIQAKTFDTLIKINQIDLSCNEIDTIYNDAFVSLPELKRIDMSNNYITRLGNLVNTLNSLDYLNLYNNSILQINFPNSKITQLNLRKNLIQNLGIGLFAGLPKLIHLDLSENAVTIVATGTFSGLHSLHHLNISHNHIEAISGFAFHNMPLLETFDVSYNNLQTFDPSNLLQATRLNFLDVKENPWKCSTMIDLINRSKLKNITIVRENSYGEISILGIRCVDDDPTLYTIDPKYKNFNGEMSNQSMLTQYMNSSAQNCSNDTKNVSQTGLQLTSNASKPAQDQLKTLLHDLKNQMSRSFNYMWIIYILILVCIVLLIIVYAYFKCKPREKIPTERHEFVSLA